MLNTAEVIDLAKEIRTEIQGGHILLPTLPEVALQVRDAVESETAGADTVAAMVAKDAALSARLLQVANSPLYGSRHTIDSLQQAVARLGLKMVRSLIISLAMKQIFQPTSEVLDRQFRAIWDDSLQVAAISRMLAGSVPELDNEQAMLGGLIHNIGALPIVTKLDAQLDHDADSRLIAGLIAELAPDIGRQILRQWNFADSLADIPRDCFDLGYDPGPIPTYADIVLVARLQNDAAFGRPDTPHDWSSVPAFAKIGLEPEVLVVDLQAPAEEIAHVRNMLDG